MKTLSRLTLHSLKLNRKRTLVTMIGILLSTALLSAVSTMVSSVQYTIIEREKETSGNYHYVFQSVPQRQLSFIEENRNVEQYFESAGIGYAYLEDSVNSEKPYIYLMAMDESSMQQAAITLKQGRFPENDGEVVISSHIKTNGGVKYQIGDVISLEVGKRVPLEETWAADLDIELLGQSFSYCENERLLPVFTREYTVVGIIDQPPYGIERYGAPGYTIITYMDSKYLDNTDPLYGIDVYVRYTEKALKNRIQTTAEILGVDPENYEKYLKGKMTAEEFQIWNETWAETFAYQENGNLIRYEVMDFSESTLETLYGMALLVILIIVGTSALCIRNSFAISITEKTKQYGMLASVGATPKQIRQNVFYEAGVLAGASIPLGIGCGCLACFVLTNIVSVFMKDTWKLKLYFYPSWQMLAAAVVLAGFTVFLSAVRPARKAGKVSPIVAIRGIQETDLKSGQVKAPEFIKKLFGMGGMIAYKNMKRAKKSYRVAVASIAVSVMVFVAMYSFMGLAFRSMDYYRQQDTYQLCYYEYNIQKNQEKLTKTTYLEDVKQASILRTAVLYAPDSDLLYTEESLEQYSEQYRQDTAELQLISIGEREYNRYLKLLGLSEEEAGSGAILINDMYDYNSDQEKYIVYDIYDYTAGDVITGTMHTEEREAEPVSLKIAAVTSQRPLGLAVWYYQNGILVVSDAWMDQHEEMTNNFGSVYYDCEDADALQDVLETEYQLSTENFYNLLANQREEQSVYLIVAIFLYGFIIVISLIGVTNILNTITTSMEVRSSEFAMLRSIGMTKKEFSHMVQMECVFYGGKALIIGAAAGILLSYLIYCQEAQKMDIGYQFPFMGILIAFGAVVVLLWGIMHTSLKKINQQNIIDTIRKENI